MVRPPYFDSNGMKKGAWSKEEDDKLRDFIQTHGHSNWRLLPVFAGLARCGKSCRLRWMNYLKPGLKRGNFTKHESDLIIALHKQLGNKWSTIAANLPGRTDNEVNYYWHAHVHKRSERNRVASKVIRGTQMPEEQQTQMPKEQQSSEINVCNIATYQNESTPSNDQNLENINVVDSTAQSDQGNNIMTHEEYYQTCYDLPPLSEDAELDRILLCQEMHNVCMFSESDGGYSTAESQLGDFWADEPLGEEATLWYFDDIKDML